VSYTINFMTAAYGPYAIFAGPYLASTLLTYPDAYCELLVHEQPVSGSFVELLRQLCGERFHFRVVSRHGKIPHTLRWLTVPEQRAELTYISDVDILVSGHGIPEYHRKVMAQTGLPYSNTYRPNAKPGRLTGLHCVATEPYYAKLTEAVQQRYWQSALVDEELLYALCEELHGIPADVSGQPQHGIHLSPQRLPLSEECGWGVQGWLTSFLRLARQPEWQALRELFHPQVMAQFISRLEFCIEQMVFDVPWERRSPAAWKTGVLV